MSTARLRIVGGLGGPVDPPLLAEWMGADGHARRVVLRRRLATAPPAVTGAVTEQEVVSTAAGRFGVEPFVDGWDLDLAAEAGLADAGVAAVLAAARRIVAVAAREGLRHGGISGASVRVDPLGGVHLVGWRGLEGEGDMAALDALAEALGADVEPDLGVLHAWVRQASPVLELCAHALADQVLEAGGAAQAAAPVGGLSPKQRMAGAAAVGLVLGVLAGRTLVPADPSPSMTVLGASEVAARCGDALYTAAERVLVPAGAPCELRAVVGGEVYTVSVTAEVPTVCRVEEGALTCGGS